MFSIGDTGDLFAGAFTGGAGPGSPGFSGSSSATTGPTTSGGGTVNFGQVGASTGNNTLFVAVAGVSVTIAGLALMNRRKKRGT